ncbi:ribose 5-phosphate isomerase B [uncultured Ferrovibrio sp.]|jgi:ribose 5-phosphate isomerase B|uniref:ribose 5-phosphate isomerase B n=1 Tax=uncultured Ferrovibrio sp. TaxID=1576913 RepID=UPI002636F1D3|nr:ribose 5-phosphate isomerase B [uncultured Ferrovibrio sp.]
MSKPTVAFAADHAGFELKNLLRDDLKAQGYSVVDLGTLSADSVDYPDFGRALGEAVSRGEAQFGVAICGSGIGISIAANRIPGCRAALCHDHLTARLARQHNDANVIALGARLIGLDTAKDCLKTFLETPFEGGRHARRVAKLGAA